MTMSGAELQDAWEMSRPAPSEVDAWVVLLQWCIEYHQKPIFRSRRPRGEIVSPGTIHNAHLRPLAGPPARPRVADTESDTRTILSPQIASQHHDREICR